MKLTKYGHACVVLEEQGKKLIIDPGVFTPEFGDVSDVAAVVITHVHSDHYSPEHLQKIVGVNPDVKVFTAPEVATEWKDPHAQAVKAGDEQTVGPFTLRFYGELHSLIHPIAPQIQNVGVLVNGSFYYPGDSFTLPESAITVLAVPANAPWAKVGESLDFIKAVAPKKFFGTHDGLLNDAGMMVTGVWFKMASDNFGVEYTPLKVGESIEI